MRLGRWWVAVSGQYSVSPSEARAVLTSNVGGHIAASDIETRAFAANAPHGYAPHSNECPSNAPHSPERIFART